MEKNIVLGHVSRKHGTMLGLSVSILEFGAVGDGKTLNTVAFQNAICYLKSFTDKGGAQLYVPSGKWLTGSLNLISHLTLFLERGATIIASLINKALAAADSTEIMKKLPKFMYEEEKARGGSSFS